MNSYPRLTCFKYEIALNCVSPILNWGKGLGSVDICVIPVKTGIQNIGMWSLLHILGYLKALDSCFRRNDGGGGLE